MQQHATLQRREIFYAAKETILTESNFASAPMRLVPSMPREAIIFPKSGAAKLQRIDSFASRCGCAKSVTRCMSRRQFIQGHLLWVYVIAFAIFRDVSRAAPLVVTRSFGARFRSFLALWHAFSYGGRRLRKFVSLAVYGRGRLNVLVRSDRIMSWNYNIALVAVFRVAFIRVCLLSPSRRWIAAPRFW